MKISRNFESTTGASKTRLHKKFGKCKLDEVTRNPEEWIIEIELIRLYLKNTNVHLDDLEMMTHIILNLPEEYQTMVEILEYKSDDDSKPLTIERIRDKLSVKFDQMNKKSRPRTSR